MSIEASHKPLSDFLGKEYLVDISPEFVYVIFPDLTIYFTIDIVMDASWQRVRTELQELCFNAKGTPADASGGIVEASQSPSFSSSA